jgi:hypothetical protein
MQMQIAQHNRQVMQQLQQQRLLMGGTHPMSSGLMHQSSHMPLVNSPSSGNILHVRDRIFWRWKVFFELFSLFLAIVAAACEIRPRTGRSPIGLSAVELLERHLEQRHAEVASFAAIKVNVFGGCFDEGPRQPRLGTERWGHWSVSSRGHGGHQQGFRGSKSVDRSVPHGARHALHESRCWGTKVRMI